MYVPVKQIYSVACALSIVISTADAAALGHRM